MPLYRKALSKYPNHVFIETGTYHGEAVALALSLGFKEIHTVDIEPGYIKKLNETHSKNPNVHGYAGDSGSLLSTILKSVHESVTVWLDAHPLITPLPIAQCPLLQELHALATGLPKAFPHVILVDDMRVFSNEDRDKILKAMLAVRPGTSVKYDDGIATADIMVGFVPGA